MSSLARRAHRYRQAQAKITLAGVHAVKRAAHKARTPAAAKAAIPVTLATYQLASASNASRTIATELGREPTTPPLAYAGTTGLGYPVTQPVDTIVDRLAADLDGQWFRLQDAMLASLALMAATEIATAGSDAASVEIAAADARYVRVLSPPSCDRCTVLAGRIYRSEEAFERHPGCDCSHWAVGSEAEALGAGLIVDPMEAFEQGQITGLSQADQQAIRDGADIFKVVNAKRMGRQPGITNTYSLDMLGKRVKATLDGTTARSAWRRKNPNVPVRLRPQGIYTLAEDHGDALRLLRLHGYL